MAPASDPFAIVTLNWDTIPDFMIHQCGATNNVVVDYACYNEALEGDADHVPSILRKSSGKLNVKLLKLHGSLNWLTCTCCGRLFSAAQKGDRPFASFPEFQKCRFCVDVKLENLIVTPTLVKDVGQTHLKMVWHNALIDLQESERIVFLGYSLPLADFEFRYVLLKAITGRDDIQVRVVLYPPDDGRQTPERLWQRKAEEERYTNFFGNRDIDFRYMDAVEFMAAPDSIWNW